ncbi:MAG TPA: YbhN family protein [Acidimicrobiia bacterium]|nr:YbhN family protein [Acidimicrobiia bacterium]
MEAFVTGRMGLSRGELRSVEHRRSPARRALRLGLSLGVVAFLGWTAASRRARLVQAAGLLQGAHPVWVATAVGTELVSFLTFVAVQRRLLRSGGVGVGLGSLTEMALVGNAISNSLPGGDAWGRIYTFRQLRRRGADPVLATWTMAAAGFLSGAALVAVTATGALLAGGRPGWYGVLGGLGAVGVLGAGLAVLHRRGRLDPVAVGVMGGLLRGWQRILRRRNGDPRAQAEAAWQRLRGLMPDRRAWASATALATVSWVADCACLAAAFWSVGAPAPWPGLVLAYGAAQLAGTLPLTLGGIGLVEGSLAVGLVAYGGRRSATVAAVVLYRLLSFWILLPIGWGLWALIARRARRAAASAGLQVAGAG